MEVTLRRANALQLCIVEALKNISANPVATLSLFDNFETKQRAEHEMLMALVSRRTALITAHYELRRGISAANDASGISDLLADMAENGQKIELTGGLANAKPADPADLTQKRADRLAGREEPASLYGRSGSPVETLMVNLLDAGEISDFQVQLLALKRKRTEIKDRLAELNAATRMTLDPETVSVLLAEHLL